MKKIWKVVRGFLALLGFTVVVFMVAGIVAVRGDKAAALPDKIVLSHVFYGTPPDAPEAPGWMGLLMPVEPTLSQVTGALYRAAGDDRVGAFVARLSSGHYEWADVQELQAALAAFKAAGKPAYVYADSYGDLYPGMAEYYLASAFDEIWIQPVGTVSITGFHAEMPYFKSALEKIGVSAEILQRGEYKTAPESALLDTMSEAQRTTLHAILSSMMTDFFASVSAGRDMPAERIGQLIDGAPYTALEAKERKLVDEVGYVDQLMDRLVPLEAKDTDLVDTLDYLYENGARGLDKVLKKEAKAIEKTQQKSVALVYVTGMIVPDDPYAESGAFGEPMAYASDVADAIAGASEDEDVGAIVVRVDSPGGSPSASETIRRAVEVARMRGKYVVVSMGSEAASGGYWVSVDADRIFAQNGTLTGSIGVFGGKPNLAGMWDKLGINWDGVEMGANATLWTPNAPYDDAQRAAIGRMMDDVYDAFVERVAKGRKFSPEVVEGMAQGRVWTGRQAKERGLVDEIGGLRAALEDVAKKLGVAGVDSLDIMVLPDTPSPFEELSRFFAASGVLLDPLRPALRSLVFARHPEWGWTHANSFAIRH